MEPELLEQIGLTHNESIIYLTLLRIGSAKTGDILRESNLNSGRIYDILESLKIKGLVAESKINNIRYFSACSPKEFIDYVEQKKTKIKKEEKIIKDLIPEMEKIRNLKKKTISSETYIGLKGLKTAVYECLDSMKKGEELLAMGIIGNKPQKYNIFWENFARGKAIRKISLKYLFSEKSKHFQELKKMPYIKTRVLKGITPASVDIFGKDKVIIASYHDPCTVTLINDPKIAESFIHFFYQLWNMAK